MKERLFIFETFHLRKAKTQVRTIDRSAVAQSAPGGLLRTQQPLCWSAPPSNKSQVRRMFIAPRPPHAVVALRSSGRSKSPRSKGRGCRSKNRWAGRFSHMRALRPPRCELLDWSKSSSKRKRSLKGLLAPSVHSRTAHASEPAHSARL